MNHSDYNEDCSTTTKSNDSCNNTVQRRTRRRRQQQHQQQQTTQHRPNDLADHYYEDQSNNNNNNLISTSNDDDDNTNNNNSTTITLSLEPLQEMQNHTNTTKTSTMKRSTKTRSSKQQRISSSSSTHRDDTPATANNDATTTTNDVTTATTTTTRTFRIEELVQQFYVSIEIISDGDGASTSSSSSLSAFDHLWKRTLSTSSNKTTTTKKKRTQEPTVLVQHVMTASMQAIPPISFSCDHEANTKASSSLLLEEHATELLAYCRTIVKAVTDDTNSHKTATASTSYSTNCANYHRVSVAIHILRSVLFGTTSNLSSTKVDAIRRLLYFCIISIPSITNTATDTNSDISTTTTTTFLCYLAYHGLGYTMENMTIPIPNSDPSLLMYHCYPRSTTTESTSNDNSSSDNVSKIHPFPIPILPPTITKSSKKSEQLQDHPIKKQGTAQNKSNNNNEKGKWDQICTMCIVASITMARTFVQDYNRTNQQRRTTQINKTTTTSHTQQQNQQSSLYSFVGDGSLCSDWTDLCTTIRYIVFDITIPWISTFISITAHESSIGYDTSSPTTSTTTAAVFVSYGKKLQRILLDLSELVPNNKEVVEVVEETNNPLLLQADSIHALLLHCNHLEQQHQKRACNRIQNALQCILLDHNIYDHACTYAWKVADSWYANNVSSKKKQKSNTITTTLQTNTQLSSKSLLDRFHESVGTVLDFFIVRNRNNGIDDNKNNNSNYPPLSYVEYCAYRSLHATTIKTYDSCCTNRDCLFRHLPYQYQHSQSSTTEQSIRSNSNDKNDAFILLFFLSRYIRYCLEQQHTQHQNDPRIINDRIKTIPSECIIAKFRSHCLSLLQNNTKENQDQVNNDTSMLFRWYNLFSTLGLHRTVYRILENGSHPSVLPMQSLHVARCIFVDCLIPLYRNLLEQIVAVQGASSDKQRIQQWTNIVTCYRLSTSIGELTQLYSTTNAYVMDLTNMLLQTKLDPSLDCLDGTAKYLYGIGKKRYELDLKYEALLPLLCSVKILIFETSMIPPGDVSTLRISSRLSFISSIYKSLDMIDESIIALCAALLFDSIEVSISMPSSRTSEDLIYWMANLTEGVVVVDSKMNASKQSIPSEQRLGLQVLLLNLFLNRKRSTTSADDTNECTTLELTPINLMDYLVVSACQDNNHRRCESVDASRRSRANEFCVQCNCADVLRICFKNTIPIQLKAFHNAITVEYIKILIDLFIRLGRNLQRATICASADNCSVSILDYISICRFAEDLASTLPFTENTIQNIAAMINLVASISLVSTHPLNNYDCWIMDPGQGKKHATVTNYTSAIELLNRAQSILENSHGIDPFTTSLLISLDLYRYQLSHLQPGPSHRINLTRLRKFSAEKQKLTTSGDQTWKYCLSNSLQRYCTILRREGEGLQALQIANWNRSIDDIFSSETRIWFESIILSLLAEISVISIQQSDSNEITHSIKFEDAACHLRLATRDADDELSLSTVEHRFQLLLGDIEQYSTSLGIRVDSLVNWSTTTAYLGLSECFERSGQLESSLKAVKRCFQLCRDTLNGLKRRKSIELNSSGLSVLCNGAFAEIALRCMQRQFECRYLAAVLYQRLGSYKKSIDYSFSLLEGRYVELSGITSKLNFAESVSLTRQYPSKNSYDTKSRRLYLRFKSLTFPLELVIDQFRKDGKIPYLSPVDSASVDPEMAVNKELERIVDMYEIVNMVNAYHVFPSYNDDEWNLHTLGTRAFVRYSLSSDIANLFSTLSSFAKDTDQPYIQLQYDSKLLDAVSALSCSANENEETKVTAVGWLEDIGHSPCAPSVCRAWSYYVIGLVSLWSAKKNRDIKSYDHHASKAIYHFSKAINILGTSCDTLIRNVNRCLAVAIGPESSKDPDGMDYFCLVNRSVGGSLKSHILRSNKGDDEEVPTDKNEHTSSWVFDSLAYRAIKRNTGDSTERFMEALRELVPPGWRFMTAALSPTGELLLTSLEFSEDVEYIISNACIGPDSFRDMKSIESTDVFDYIMTPLNDILIRSNELLSGGVVDCDDDNDDGNSKAKNAKLWWRKRMQLDSDLRELLENVDQALLSSEMGERVLLGQSARDSSLDESIDDAITMPCGNLTSLFDAAIDLNKPNSVSEDVEVVRENIDDVHISNQSACNRNHVRINETFSCLSSDKEQCLSPFPIKRNQTGTSRKEDCIFLILDENLVSFPFESLPSLDGKTVCRLPSLPFALYRLLEYGNGSNLKGTKPNMPTFNPRRTSYIIDPESNLSGTKDRVTHFLDSVQSKISVRWDNTIVGKIPTNEFMKSAMESNDGMLLYFGHGGGQQFFGRTAIESLGVAAATGTRTNPSSLSSVILMGCGSGRLESVHMKYSKHITTTKKVPIHYDPEGVALSYLLAGSPCVVGNLWDVTDRDIDRYAMNMIELIYDTNTTTNTTSTDTSIGSSEHRPRTTSIPRSVAQARNVCKLRYINGCAPVCYGFPVTMSNIANATPK